MTDQTPDPWKTVFMRTAGTCVPGMWVYPADEVSEALAAERAQHQQEIARLSAQVRKLEAELALAHSAGSRDLNLRMNEANKALRAELDAVQQQIATLTQERDEARKKCADNERGYESLIRRYEHSVSAETARADAAEARCASLTTALKAVSMFAETEWPSQGHWDRVKEQVRTALSGIPTP